MLSSNADRGDPMLRFLFPRLTPAPHEGAPLFDAVTEIARAPHWYVAGEVPDTIEGRFRMLATVAALVMVRLEQLGEEGNRVSVALTERFVEVMESEHREMGLGDPKLGRTVRKLVGSLARRVELWRAALDGAASWNDAARESVYKLEPGPAALPHTAEALRELWPKLEKADAAALAEGRIP